MLNQKYSYKRSGNPWTQVGADIDGQAAEDRSGSSVAMSSDGNRVAIGSPYNDANGSNSGSVRVYDWDGTWTQVGGDINGEDDGDQFGFSIAISSDGNYIAIGGKMNDGNGSNSGSVRVYEYISGTWTQVGTDINGEDAGDYFGYSVAMSSDGNRIAIGATYNDGNGTRSGHVRVYDWDGTWTQVGADIDGENQDDRSGHSVAMSSNGNRVAIGAIRNDGNGQNSGHVRIYEWIANAWTQVGADIDGKAISDESGYSVAMSSDGNRVAIGAPYNDGGGDNNGHVRVYQYVNGTWTQVGADINGEAVDDFSGVTIAMSSDGSRIAIGASSNDGNGDKSGHVRVYEWVDTSSIDSNTPWTQVGPDIDGEAIDDVSGSSVAISDDGSRVAIGAKYNSNNDTNYIKRGHVRIFTEPTANGGGFGDPIITPMFDHMYDLPCDSNNYVMFDNQDVNERLILNVKCWVLPEDERRKLQEYADKVWNKKCNILSYMRYASVFWEGQWKVYDLDNLTQVTPIDGKFNNAINNFKLKVLSQMEVSKDDQVINAKSFYSDAPSKVATLKFNTKKHGLISFSFKLFDDPEIRNGISISGRHVTKSTAFGGFIACADFKKLRLKRPHEIQNPNNQSWDHKMILQKFPTNYMGKTIDVIMYRLTRHSHRILNV
uniref:FG-GAP repeat containing protein n=1 Tax=Megaviridae environmental sample TaxID=1737588 RepID=A0A5J6VJ74_9VIRU|nr:MAG: FG-GAP repeat containing protein [Megaviridae environmental sample]